MFDSKSLFAKKEAGNLNGAQYKKITDIITNIEVKGYEDKFVVFEGVLMYSGDSKEEGKWCFDNGIPSTKSSEQVLHTMAMCTALHLSFL